MKNEKDFEEIGKKIPYSVPGDFFEKITPKTLEKAKEEKRKSGIRKMIISVSVAATVLIVFSIGFSVLKIYKHKPEIETAQNLEPEIHEIETQVEEIIQMNPDERTLEKESTTVQTGKLVPAETIEILLTELTDEELRELASILTEELFFDDLTIELQ